MSIGSILRVTYNWTAQVVDPIRFARGIRGFAWYLRDYRRYARMEGAEPLSLRYAEPSLHEHSRSHDLDPHYFYVNGWAARRIISKRPARHIDVGSQTVLASLLSASMPVMYVDYRPLRVGLDGLGSIAASLTALPFRDDSVSSLSCLHVAEHVGLGRYGDPLDPYGTRNAARELSRVLAPGGSLFFAVPVGRQRVAFNAHRIHRAALMRDYFADLALVEYSGVGDEGRFHERLELDAFDAHSYGCGMFWFRKETR